MSLPKAPKGKNPRDHENYKARGRKRGSYTVEDIGLVVGLSPSTVKTYGLRGAFQLENFGSVVSWILRRRFDLATPLTTAPLLPEKQYRKLIGALQALAEQLPRNQRARGEKIVADLGAALGPGSDPSFHEEAVLTAYSRLDSLEK